MCGSTNWPREDTSCPLCAVVLEETETNEEHENEETTVSESNHPSEVEGSTREGGLACATFINGPVR